MLVVRVIKTENCQILHVYIDKIDSLSPDHMFIIVLGGTLNFDDWPS